MQKTIINDVFGTTPRKSINSKNKGSVNERALAKILSKWTGEEFVRIPMSGGLRWKNARNICGDIMCTNDAFDFPFAIETKHLKLIEFAETLRSNSKVFTIWEQADRDAKRAGKLPMLVLRINNMKSGTYLIYTNFKLLNFKVVSEGAGLFGYASTDIFSTDYKIIHTFVKTKQL